MTAGMSVIVQPCVNSTWRGCMYATRLAVNIHGGGVGGGFQCVRVCGEGARPTACQYSHMEDEEEGGMSVCI